MSYNSLEVSCDKAVMEINGDILHVSCSGVSDEIIKNFFEAFGMEHIVNEINPTSGLSAISREFLNGIISRVPLRDIISVIREEAPGEYDEWVKDL